MIQEQSKEPPSTRHWQRLEKIERRVAGVLVEKAKTTPENYPLSLNALVNGCNQKSNRAPQMQLDDSQVEEALDRLRSIGAVALIQGDGRVDKYRHLLYEWLGVDKVELAVMAELLLRGAQTIGELRGRAARMEPIKDIAALQPIVESLRQKGLLVLLSPPGRGCVVTHALYQPQELEKLRADHGNASTDEPLSVSSHEIEHSPMPTDDGAIRDLRNEVAALREQLNHVQKQCESEIGQLRGDLQELNRQLGV